MTSWLFLESEEELMQGAISTAGQLPTREHEPGHSIPARLSVTTTVAASERIGCRRFNS